MPLIINTIVAFTTANIMRPNRKIAEEPLEIFPFTFGINTEVDTEVEEGMDLV
jgi:hypothetical protein